MKNEIKEVEFQFQDLLPIGVTLVVLSLVVAYGLQIMGEAQDDMTSDSAEYNATGAGIEAVGEIPNRLGTIVTIIIAAVIIGILIRYFMRMR